MYNFVILDPWPIPAAQEANEKVFASGQVYGIEVTIPALATRCAFNLDPQHAGGDSEKAAIEAAVALVMEYDKGRPCCGGTWDTYHCPKCDGADCPPPVPSTDSTLATVRADLDSIGAMAIFSLHAEGVERSLAAERIRLIAESDRFARGGWSGVRPLPTAEQPYDDSVASAESDSRLAPMAAAVADFKVPLVERVELMKKWLLTGEEPAGYRDRWVAERKALATAIADGTIKAEAVAGGKIAVVISTHRAATSVGYCLAPVVVAFNPEFRLAGGEPHKKFTVCQFTADYVNLKAALAELAALEPGWGGSPIIGGSPQGTSSAFTIEQVVGVVKNHLYLYRQWACGAGIWGRECPQGPYYG